MWLLLSSALTATQAEGQRLAWKDMLLQLVLAGLAGDLKKVLLRRRPGVTWPTVSEPNGKKPG